MSRHHHFIGTVVALAVGVALLFGGFDARAGTIAPAGGTTAMRPAAGSTPQAGTVPQPFNLRIGTLPALLEQINTQDIPAGWQIYQLFPPVVSGVGPPLTVPDILAGKTEGYDQWLAILTPNPVPPGFLQYRARQGELATLLESINLVDVPAGWQISNVIVPPLPALGPDQAVVILAKVDTDVHQVYMARHGKLPALLTQLREIDRPAGWTLVQFVLPPLAGLGPTNDEWVAVLQEPEDRNEQDMGPNQLIFWERHAPLPELVDQINRLDLPEGRGLLMFAPPGLGGLPAGERDQWLAILTPANLPPDFWYQARAGTLPDLVNDLNGPELSSGWKLMSLTAPPVAGLGPATTAAIIIPQTDGQAYAYMARTGKLVDLLAMIRFNDVPAGWTVFQWFNPVLAGLGPDNADTWRVVLRKPVD